MFGYKYSANLRVMTRPEDKQIVIAAVQAFCNIVGMCASAVKDVEMSVSEAFDNCRHWAYPDTPGEVSILMFQRKTENCIYIHIYDEGCSIDNVDKAMQPSYTTGRKAYHAGMGFSIMKQYMTEVSVTSPRHLITKRGTVVTMRKVIK